MLWTLNFLWGGCGRAPTSFGHAKFETKNFFEIFSFTKHSALNFSEGVSRPIFFGHAKFEVKNFSKLFPLPSALDSEFFRGVLCTNFFGSCQIWGQKIFQNFFTYWVLWTLNFSDRGSGQQLFWSHQIWGQNFSEFFHLSSAVDSEFFLVGGVSGHQLFLVMQNLRSKNFAEFFHLSSTLDSEFIRKGSGQQLFGSQQIWSQKIFWNFFIYWALWTLNFSEGGLGTNFLWSRQIWGQTIFRISSFTECSGLNLSEGGPSQLFLVTPNLNLKFFKIFSFTECSGLWIFQRGWSGYQTLFTESVINFCPQSRFFERSFFISWCKFVTQLHYLATVLCITCIDHDK